MRALALSLLVVLAGCDRGKQEERRLARAVDVATTHFHVAIRTLLQSDEDGAFLRDLRAAPTDEAAAERVARAAYDRRAAAAALLRSGGDRAVGPVLPAVRARGGEAGLDRERALLLLGSLVTLGERERDAVPTPVLLYEASRIDVSTLRPVARPFVHAMRAWAFAQGGLCAQAETEGERALVEPPAAAVDGVVRHVAARGLEDPARLIEHLARVRRLLGDSARACCLIREGEHRRAAARFSRRLDDAEALGVDAPRVAILRAWVALAGGETTAAERYIAEVREADLREADQARYKMVRDVLATDGSRAPDDALARLVDRRWLSRFTLEAAVAALGRDGLWDALTALGATGDAFAIARGEAAAVRAAREIFPFFDRAHAADRNLLGRMR